jgi:tetratricopeptide (TPR) repeat protein
MNEDPRYRDLIEQGLQASRDNRGTEALELFTLATQADPSAGGAQFLLGSEYASAGNIEAAERAFANAVLLAPDFHLARYQLGLLQFSSERAGAALVTWQPLLVLQDEPLGHFVRGFAGLARDGFVEALAHFRHGLACSSANPAVAADIENVVQAIENLRDPAGEPRPLTSADHVLLSGYARGLH